MWSFIANVANLLMGAAAAASLSESLAQSKRRRREERQLKRGMILPKEAARELERRIGGRISVGKDLDGYLLVVVRHRAGTPVPRSFGGYRVIRQPKLTLVE